MPKTFSLLRALKDDFPDITFVESDTFRWSPEDTTVYYRENEDDGLLLHEVAHAALGHTQYTRDIELLRFESEAWECAASWLSKKYAIDIEQEQIESMLDTYRDWLHKRSTCPSCQDTGVQTDKNHYSCLACLAVWRVNEARTCALRRYQTK